MRKNRHSRWIIALALFGGSLVGTLAAHQDAPVRWKPVAMALLRVDDAPPKNWQVYRSEKRKQLILVRIGARFLLLDLQSRRAYELAARTLVRKQEALEWNDPGEPAQSASSAQAARDESAKPDKLLVPSSDWSMRDVGPAMRIRFRLTDEGRDFDVQFPIQPDLRQFY